MGPQAVLGLALLHEKVTRGQAAGLPGAAVATAAPTAGWGRAGHPQVAE
ncbi:hypothetical protein [Streptomyces sp. MMG1533]|nr:hypothetical protein [Streptomyces sp. MMG1533]